MQPISRRDFHRTVSLATLGLTLGVSTAEAEEDKLLEIQAKKRPDRPWETYPTRTVSHLKGFKPKSGRKLGDRLGLSSEKTKKTGFWHIEKHGNRFWLVDPDGCLNIHRAVCSVNPGRNGEQQAASFKEKFRTKDAWGEATVKLLREYSFNGTGSWTDLPSLEKAPSHQASPLAHTLNLSLMDEYGKDRSVQVPGHRGYPNDGIFVFDPDFEAFCDQSVAKKVADLKDDPNFLGYFTDNELPFKMNTLEGYLKLENPDDHGRKSAEVWLAKRGKMKDQIENQDRWEFLGYLGDRYSSITAKAIRKHDPNHLVLGPRLYSDNRVRPTLMKSIAKYIDIISFNYYGVWTPLEEQIKGWTQWTGKPFTVTEWYTKGEDSGLPNTTGAGWVVKTQKDRGAFYQNYTLALLESGNCVGWHWFKYQDNDPTAKNPEPSNIDANKGIVGNRYEPYVDFLSAAKQINENVFDLIEYFDAKKS